MNVLRKAFQTKHTSILAEIAQQAQIDRKVEELIDKLGLAADNKG